MREAKPAGLPGLLGESGAIKALLYPRLIYSRYNKVTISILNEV